MLTYTKLHLTYIKIYILTPKLRDIASKSKNYLALPTNNEDRCIELQDQLPKLTLL